MFRCWDDDVDKEERSWEGLLARRVTAMSENEMVVVVASLLT